MKTITLSLRYSDQSLHKPVAWLVRGHAPDLWLTEIAEWNAPHQDLRLHPLPTSLTDRTPSAVLVIAKNERPHVHSRRAIPYGQVARRLYLPVNAALEPDVTEAELNELLPSDNVYVFHPSLGLIGFEPHDVLGISDLLKPRDSNDRDWNLAQPGVAISSRVSSITPTATPSIQEIIDGGRGDIGTQSESLDELPPSPDEPKEGVIHNAGHKARSAIANAIRWVTSKVPDKAGEPTWINRVEDWAESMLSRAKSEIERRREKEMHRLMHMLEEDPDQGLRHAIPMGSEAHRGLAPPSDRLGTHNVDFRLGQLGGGAAADYWDISWEMQQRLTQRYRELANRELNLGRHRRAAYIFAELLNDLHSAASALVNGRHWREAAVLYRDKLKNPSEAAKCLENGGLWDEAITLHKELGNLEKAGDLTLQLEQVEAAHDLYRQAVEKHEQSNDHINAARLLDEKLASPSEALTTLEGGWPFSSQAALCLRQKFRLLARLGMHDESQKRVTTLRDEVLPENVRVVGVSVLAELASTYPEQSLRALSADSARVRVSRELPNVNGADASLLVRAITGLEPHDRLLDRDGRRFLSLRAAEARAIQPTQARRPRQTGRSLTLVKSIVLPRTPELNYTHAVIQGDRVYAVGMDNGTPSFTRASLDSDVDNSIKTCPTSKQGTNPNSFVVFAVSYGPTMRMLYQPVGGGMLRDHTVFEGTDQYPDTVTVRGFSQNDSMLMGSCFSGGSEYVVLTMEQSGMVLKTLTEDGGIAGTFALVHPMFKSRTNLPVPMIKRRDDLFFAWNDSLLSFSRGEILTAAQFDSPITNIAASSPHTRPRIAVTTENGASVYWRDFEGELTRPVETDLQVSQLAINSGGYLVLAGETSCEVFATQNRQLRFEAAAHYEDCEPIAVLPGPRTDQFAIVTSAGLIRFFELQ